MDPLQNPFSPGAGSPPPELVGRDGILEQARILLGRVRQRKPEKSLLLTGLRGVGKTVLLNTIERRAREMQFLTILVEAHENKPLAALLVPHLRAFLIQLDRLAGVKKAARRAMAVLASFVKALKVTVSDVTIGLDIDPEPGVADSGDIEIDLPQLFQVVGEAASDRDAALALFIDEVQYFDQKELGALIMAMHKSQQLQSPITLVGAGLPILPGLAGESKSYAERLFEFPNIGELSAEDAARALQEPARAAGAEFTTDALEEVHRATRGYPYFVQEWGYQAWNLATTPCFDVETIRRVRTESTRRLDNNFFRVRFDRLTPAEKTMLRAMASLGPGPQRTSDVAERLKVKLASLGPRRASLIKKGMIYSPAHGDLAFTVPLFDEFMVRAMPNWP